MRERQRLLALLEICDTAIEELYVLGDSAFVDLILRLERRRQQAARRLAELDGVPTYSGRLVVSSPSPDGAYLLREAS